MSTAGEMPVLVLSDVAVDVGGRRILGPLDWRIAPCDRWVVLGANGSGKSTLIRVAALYRHPSTGTVDVLGERLGRTDVRTLRRRIGLAAASLADELRPSLTAREVVMTARYAALEPWWHSYTEHDRQRADDLLHQLGCGAMTDRRFGTLSSGERQRVLLARTLMSEPGLVLLDEPTAGLDLHGRETLVAGLGRLAADPTNPPTVLVTHHVEEIPADFTHVLMLAAGQPVACGPIESTLTESSLSACFGGPLRLERRHGRWWAWGSGG